MENRENRSDLLNLAASFPSGIVHELFGLFRSNIFFFAFRPTFLSAYDTLIVASISSSIR